MHAPRHTPVGLKLAATAKAVSRVLDDALAAAGGSLATWQVLVTVKSRQSSSQTDIAAAMGIQGATLTHHLNAMERDGLLTRARSAANRRVHTVQLTDSGEELFLRLRDVAIDFDRRLRRGLSPEDLTEFERVLDALTANATTDEA